MNGPIHVLIRLLMAAFAVGAAGCVILIPVVALKFAAVVFETDPPIDAMGQE
jgi:hypothetical protein